MEELTFRSTPSTPWLKLAVKRGKGGALPALTAVLEEAQSDGQAAYAEVCGLPPSDHLPLTLPHVLAGPLHMRLLAHESVPLPAMGLVHVAQRIVQHRPLAAGEPLRLRCEFGGMETVKQGVEIELITKVLADDGVPWQGTATLLSRAVKGSSGPVRTDPPPIPTTTRSTTWRPGADLGRRYAAVSGDYNPIHMHPLTAKLFGFPRTIVHGMWTLARSVAELDPPAGAWTLDVVFRRPVLLPSTVLFTSDGQSFQLCRPRDGKLHLYGSLTPSRAGSS